MSADVYDAQMSPMEAVVLNAMMTGSSLLNLRAHFLNQLPDLRPLAGMLTHLNLSFNDLWVSSDLNLPLIYVCIRGAICDKSKAWGKGCMGWGMRGKG